MLLIDFNGVLINQVAVATKQLGASNVGLKEIKSYFFSEFLRFKSQFQEYSNEIVIACDTSNTWRKAYFPFYKVKRKSAKASAPFDWELVTEALQTIQKDLVEYFPYKTIKVDACEADDIIATLCIHKAKYSDGIQVNNEPIMIVSADQDFLQLQVIKGLKQYSTMTKKELVHANPNLFLFEKIMKGDSGDCVPNILAGDDFIANGIRQPSITAQRLDKWTEFFIANGKLHEDLTIENYNRNKTLMDLLNCIPENLTKDIIGTYENYVPASRMKLHTYFIKNQLEGLYQEIQKF